MKIQYIFEFTYCLSIVESKLYFVYPLFLYSNSGGKYSEVEDEYKKVGDCVVRMGGMLCAVLFFFY